MTKPDVVIVVGASAPGAAPMIAALRTAGRLVALIDDSRAALRSIVNDREHDPGLLAYPIRLSDTGALREAVTDITSEWGPVGSIVRISDTEPVRTIHSPVETATRHARATHVESVVATLRSLEEFPRPWSGG